MDIRKEDGVVVMRLTAADLNAPQPTLDILQRAVQDDSEQKIVADLSAIESIYSLQIGTLVAMHVLCYENVAVMKLSGVNEKVKNLLRMVGLEAMMEMHHGASVAIQSFGPREGG